MVGGTHLLGNQLCHNNQHARRVKKKGRHASDYFGHLHDGTLHWCSPILLVLATLCIGAESRPDQWLM